ncbi:helix-turn-helix transcriptional regulator [Reichenbachiella sp.]|uniref:helix-turn-helix transcriptional regulator n=1 Tax=Reichenbachiella sp. TaxID=2184521 RepID=UPI003BAEC7D1
MYISSKNTIFKNFFNSGVKPETSLDDLRRIRLVNVLSLASIVFTPLMFLYNWRIGNVQELYPLSFYLVSFVVIYFINRRKNQLASCILILASITTSWWVMFVSTTQVGAPYFNILFGLLAIYLLKNSILKNLFIILSFSSFALLNWYQLMHRPFALAEYGPILILLIVLYLAAVSYDSMYQKNEMTIQQQSQELMRLTEEKHKQAMALKQKDMDTVTANNQMQLKIRENILNDLDQIKIDEGGKKQLRSLRLTLRSQIETQKKLQYSQEKIKESNAELYDRLLSQFPNLNKRELELSSYIRLGLSAREMADLLSSTENSIYVTKNRLRSKLNLSSEVDINTFLINF